MKLSDFKDFCAGQKSNAFIIGKGPNLDRIDEIRDQLDALNTSVFCCNESIRKIESLHLNNPRIFAVQQDSELEYDCVPKYNNTHHFMNEFQHSPSSKRKEIVKESPWNPSAVLYGHPELAGNTTLTAIVCVRLAAYMGIENVTFCCFDSWKDGWKGSGEYATCIGKQSGSMTNTSRHGSNGCEILREAKRVMKTIDTLCPVISPLL